MSQRPVPFSLRNIPIGRIRRAALLHGEKLALRSEGTPVAAWVWQYAARGLTKGNAVALVEATLFTAHHIFNGKKRELRALLKEYKLLHGVLMSESKALRRAMERALQQCYCNSADAVLGLLPEEDRCPECQVRAFLVS